MREESAHDRTLLAAAVNISHLLCSQGRPDAAKPYLDQALVEPSTNIHLRLAALDSWANQLINRGDYETCRNVLSQATAIKHSTGQRLHWDALTELFSNARRSPAQAEGDWWKACESLDKGAKVADQFGDLLWGRRMRLVRARCLAKSGATAEALVDLRQGINGDARQPQELAEYCSAVAAIGGKPFSRQGDYSRRAARIAGAISDDTLKERH